MVRRSILRWLLLGSVLFGVCVSASGQSSLQPNHPSVQRGQKRQGFFEYVLGKINPQDKDYGAVIETCRRGTVEHTIDDLYFWSNVVALFLICVLTAIVLLQWRATDKREVIAASLIAQLWNGRVSDRVEIERRTEQFNRLVKTHNAEVERTLSPATSTSEKNEQVSLKLSRNVRNLADSSRVPSPETAIAAPVAVEDAKVGSLQQNNLLLQRRVEALQNSEKNLKQRLNQATVLLDQERRRNATLKGA